VGSPPGDKGGKGSERNAIVCNMGWGWEWGGGEARWRGAIVRHCGKL